MDTAANIHIFLLSMFVCIVHTCGVCGQSTTGSVGNKDSSHSDDTRLLVEKLSVDIRDIGMRQSDQFQQLKQEMKQNRQLLQQIQSALDVLHHGQNKAKNELVIDRKQARLIVDQVDQHRAHREESNRDEEIVVNVTRDIGEMMKTFAAETREMQKKIQKDTVRNVTATVMGHGSHVFAKSTTVDNSTESSLSWIRDLLSDVARNATAEATTTRQDISELRQQFNLSVREMQTVITTNVLITLRDSCSSLASKMGHLELVQEALRRNVSEDLTSTRRSLIGILHQEQQVMASNMTRLLATVQDSMSSQVAGLRRLTTLVNHSMCEVVQNITEQLTHLKNALLLPTGQFQMRRAPSPANTSADDVTREIWTATEMMMQVSQQLLHLVNDCRAGNVANELANMNLVLDRDLGSLKENVREMYRGQQGNMNDILRNVGVEMGVLKDLINNRTNHGQSAIVLQNMASELETIKQALQGANNTEDLRSLIEHGIADRVDSARLEISDRLGYLVNLTVGTRSVTQRSLELLEFNTTSELTYLRQNVHNILDRQTPQLHRSPVHGAKAEEMEILNLLLNETTQGASSLRSIDRAVAAIEDKMAEMQHQLQTSITANFTGELMVAMDSVSGHTRDVGLSLNNITRQLGNVHESCSGAESQITTLNEDNQRRLITEREQLGLIMNNTTRQIRAVEDAVLDLVDAQRSALQENVIPELGDVREIVTTFDQQLQDIFANGFMTELATVRDSMLTGLQAVQYSVLVNNTAQLKTLQQHLLTTQRQQLEIRDYITNNMLQQIQQNVVRNLSRHVTSVGDVLLSTVHKGFDTVIDNTTQQVMTSQNALSNVIRESTDKGVQQLNQTIRHATTPNVIVAYNVRLVNGTSSVGRAGRLEVFYNGRWGTVCDDDFEDVDASVVCRSLGFSSVGRAVMGDRQKFGAGTGDIWLDGVACDGTEVRLDLCRHSGFGVHNCAHSEDVAVIC